MALVEVGTFDIHGRIPGLKDRGPNIPPPAEYKEAIMSMAAARNHAERRANE